MRIYLAGPMSGRPQFNFPQFHRVSKLLRANGWDVVSPAELDEEDSAEAAHKSSTGKMEDAAHSWGHYLSRDVRIIADEGIEGIILLPEWDTSRGARLEASVGLLCKTKFFDWTTNDMAVPVQADLIAYRLYVANMEALKNEYRKQA